jgi:hypothetical protein
MSGSTDLKMLIHLRNLDGITCEGGMSRRTLCRVEGLSDGRMWAQQRRRACAAAESLLLASSTEDIVTILSGSPAHESAF